MDCVAISSCSFIDASKICEPLQSLRMQIIDEQESCTSHSCTPFDYGAQENPFILAKQLQDIVKIQVGLRMVGRHVLYSYAQSSTLLPIIVV